jgi:hypothetical protein
MIPISVAASRPRKDRNASPARLTSSEELAELDGARRRASLLSLLAIYTVGLGLTVLLYQGEDIGVLLSAFFAHAMVMATRALLAAKRACAVPTKLGTLVVHSRARLVPWHRI